MNNKIYPALITFLLSSFIGLAQQPALVGRNLSATEISTTQLKQSKFDLRLYKRLQNGNVNNTAMPLLVKGELSAIKTLTEQYGGVYKYGYNNVSSVEIPERNLLLFSNNPEVTKIQTNNGKGTFLMDTSRIRNNIDSLHRGFAPLIDSLKGKDVVIGIIDGGIYWQHFDFKNPADSTTRIQYIWDQVATGGSSPVQYGYGVEWTAAQINNNLCTHVPPANDFGHGTCVAGIAAGNSLSTKGTAYENQMIGIAPEADIIAVRVDNNTFQSSVADAVSYIFQKADSLGKPCVINTSIGDYYGSHDGNDLTTQVIDALIAQKNGRALVAAAGNGGNIQHHLSYNIPLDSAFTWFKYINSTGDLYFDWWADTADFTNAYFAIGCNNGTTGADSGRTIYYNVPIDFNPAPGSGTYNSATLFGPGGANLGLVEMFVSLDDNRYHAEVLITPTNASYLWRLQTKGTGTFDLWASEALTGSSNMTSYLNSVFITNPAYRHPDFDKTMVSGWQNSDKVITVGNYSNRASYLDYYGNTVNLLQSPYNEVVGQRFATSSFGPTRDNRLKPDVMATGSTTICTGDANYIAAAIPSNSFKLSITHKHVRNGGTSMASPVVAGIVALYLDKYPNASYTEIKQALICTAKSDVFTGTTPNNEYGNGKVDGFAAIAHSCIVYGNNTDTSCLYYNPAANTDTGCIAKVYGVMDTACLNYNPLANVSGGTCTPKVYGIMDTACLNYNSLANVSGGTCTPKVYGIMDTACLNYNSLANVSGGTCTPKVYGVMDTACLNYNSLANVSGGTCTPKVYGIMDTACLNYNPLANVSGGTCTPKVYGIMDTACINYNPNANVASGSCIAKVYGPTDSTCTNFNPFANVDNGNCVTSVLLIGNNKVTVRVLPNPFSSETTFSIEGLTVISGSIKIFNLLGELSDEIKLTANKNTYHYQNNKLAKGVYQYLLQAGQKNIRAGKLVVQ